MLGDNRRQVLGVFVKKDCIVRCPFSCFTAAGGLPPVAGLLCLLPLLVRAGLASRSGACFASGADPLSGLPLAVNAPPSAAATSLCCAAATSPPSFSCSKSAAAIAAPLVCGSVAVSLTTAASQRSTSGCASADHSTVAEGSSARFLFADGLSKQAKYVFKRGSPVRCTEVQCTVLIASLAPAH